MIHHSTITENTLKFKITDEGTRLGLSEHFKNLKKKGAVNMTAKVSKEDVEVTITFEGVDQKVIFEAMVEERM